MNYGDFSLTLLAVFLLTILTSLGLSLDGGAFLTTWDIESTSLAIKTSNSRTFCSRRNCYLAYNEN